MITDNRTTESRDAGSGPTPLTPAGKPPRMVVMFVGRALTADVLREALAAWPAASSSEHSNTQPETTRDATDAPDATAAPNDTVEDRTRAAGAAPETTLGTPPAEPALELHTYTSQKAVLQEIRGNPPQAILIEVDDKPESRVRFCEMLRYRLPSVTLIAVAKPPMQSKFEFDTTVALPLDGATVVARLREVAAQLVGHVLQVGAIRLNVATRTVYTPNGQHHMTPKQSALLQFLMAHANEVVGRGEIMESVWETDYLEDTRTLDVHIRWLRECIEPDPSNPVYLITERGKGYTLQV